MTGYLNIFKDIVRKMSFLTDNNEFLERYTTVSEKISDLINKKFDSDPVYNNKYINAKTRSYNNEICMILIIKKINYQKKTNHISACH